MHTQDFGSLRTVLPKLLLRVISFRKKDRTRYKPLLYEEALKRTGSKSIETIVRKRQVGFVGALIRKVNPKLSTRIVLGWLAVQGPNRGRPETSWEHFLYIYIYLGALPP